MNRIFTYSNHILRNIWVNSYFLDVLGISFIYIYLTTQIHTNRSEQKCFSSVPGRIAIKDLLVILVRVIHCCDETPWPEQLGKERGACSLKDIRKCRRVEDMGTSHLVCLFLPVLYHQYESAISHLYLEREILMKFDNVSGPQKSHLHNPGFETWTHMCDFKCMVLGCLTLRML